MKKYKRLEEFTLKHIDTLIGEYEHILESYDNDTPYPSVLTKEVMFNSGFINGKANMILLAITDLEVMRDTIKNEAKKYESEVISDEQGRN